MMRLIQICLLSVIAVVSTACVYTPGPINPPLTVVGKRVYDDGTCEIKLKDTAGRVSSSDNNHRDMCKYNIGDVLDVVPR